MAVGMGGLYVGIDPGRRWPPACANQGWHLPGRMGPGRGRPWSALAACVCQPRLAPAGAN